MPRASLVRPPIDVLMLTEAKKSSLCRDDFAYIESWNQSGSEPLPHRRPAISDIKKSTIKMKNKILAIDAAPAAIPKKPNAPAMRAMMRKITVQRNIAL